MLLCASGNETASIQILLVGHLEDQLAQAALNARAHLDEPAGLLKVANLAAGRVVIVVLLTSIGRQVVLLCCVMLLLMVMKYLLVESGRPWERHHHFVLGGRLLISDEHIVIVDRCTLRQIQSRLLMVMVFREVLLVHARIDQFLVRSLLPTRSLLRLTVAQGRHNCGIV